MAKYAQILDFWVSEIGPKRWYNGSPELDETTRGRFMADWEAALDGDFSDWKETPQGCLGYLILTDQFPRNMFRNDPRAFATDAMARRVATYGVENDFDLQVDRVVQEFFYLPFEHSEDMVDQLRCEIYISTRMSTPEVSLLHARAHQVIIRQFGRFPYRNKALGRDSTEAELSFLNNNGYQGVLKTLQN